ncbi:NAD(P)-binding protein [Guyanagaster necrorhizus]|uniref:NAD(P)-binding protein n=1 Tax=Guyanagaster necrorhizus TaxID=856835 RepID=A0A9P7VK12_9AGAR|nr:NAD(P)-binding protein [Guyanagaster necrorhizus MCA 3950]KAG7441750.1 NAD(P)-binding protein [Guyanagaster necrorhizus MCA 3950]
MANAPVAVIAGLGSGTGTGAATARLLAKEGYAIALIARGSDSLKAIYNEINIAGGTAVSFLIPSYSAVDVNTIFDQIRARYDGQPIRFALYNVGHGVWKPFLDITPEDVQAVNQTNIEGAFAFSNNVIRAFLVNEIDEKGKRGSLIFTGATASVRGNVSTSAFSAGKHAMRALSQSLAKEFGKQNIHVSHAIIDGGILTNLSRQRRNDPAWEQNEDLRLSPEGIAESYLYLAKQPRSTWTWELDLRPAHEKW